MGGFFNDIPFSVPFAAVQRDMLLHKIGAEVVPMLCDLSPEELSYLATTFAVTLSKGLDEHSMRVLCSFFVDVVGTLNLITSQRSCIEKHHEKCEEHHDKHKNPHDRK